MTWTVGLQIATIALVLLVPYFYKRQKPGLIACAGVVLYTICFFAQNLWQLAYVYLEAPKAFGFAMRLYPFSLLLLLAMFAAAIFLWSTRTRPIVVNLQGQLVWLVVLIAKAVAVAEFAQCKLFVDPFGAEDYLLSYIWGIEVSRFACGRQFGEVAPFVVPVVTALTFLWISWQARGVKR